MANHNELGKKGEELALQYLIELGYDILKINLRLKRTEIDIVATYQNELIFVEVKTRKSLEYRAQELISSSKQETLLRAADLYKETYDFRGEIFFELLCVIFDNKKAYKFEHYKDILYEL